MKKVAFVFLSIVCYMGSVGQVSLTDKRVYGKSDDLTVRAFNPILPDFVADPSVAMFNGRFYLYGTTDINQGLEKMGPPVVWISDDFVNWHFEGLLMQGIDWDKAHEFIDAKGTLKKGYFRYWAPGKPLHKEGKYYLFPTIVTPNEQMGTYVVVADKPEGPYVFLDGKTLSFNDSLAANNQATALIPDIDGEPFIDDDGQAYIYWRRRFASKLSKDFRRLEGETVSIPTSFGGYSEGPIMFKRGEWYYYVYTLSGHANYCNGYMMSKESPLYGFKKPEGKGIFIWSDINEGVWGPGHGNVFQMPGTDDFYFLYLEYGEGGTTRQVFVNKMVFNSDGTIAPMKLTFEGVGALQPSSQMLKIPLKGKVEASSVKVPRLVKTLIAPDPNLLTNLRVNAENGQPVERTFKYEAQNAIDNSNGTCWRADEADGSPTLTIDLGRAKKIEEVHMSFTLPTYGHAWELSTSLNGKKWKTSVVQNTKRVCSPHVVKNVGKARYLKVLITDGEPGLWEFKVFGR